MQTKASEPSQLMKLEKEMEKREYINLAANVLRDMNKEIENMKNSFKKKPIVETAHLKKWLSRGSMVLLAGSIFYREVWPKVQRMI